ncbi:MAG: hypothetical protein A3E79_14545 [Burkholderiales bacterium RIFCSPHIGHO2_12_FULL_61_11]|nr:MAG: hypothetical protein A3E79_14545 [Burkholderiales bacterium RIFCSPHIGHO2_12_FULL_61_11]
MGDQDHIGENLRALTATTNPSGNKMLHRHAMPTNPPPVSMTMAKNGLFGQILIFQQRRFAAIYFFQP